MPTQQHSRTGKRTVGVDAAAHAGALDAGGRTVVGLGCGLDVPYPRANTGLFARVRAGGGTLVSEHPPATQPRAAHFLPRNRFIADSLGGPRSVTLPGVSG
jgi:DNA processing protein